ncbi:aminopeptidase N-like [Lethenteron reissneri]|uniref:aminopeptidase N-like n=1 Tax=Lethenteron reissneri TaxID=7753 RepID=UPI002AB739CE|nr:aminopeptidase N-like [Lethenteron reissneri]
MSGIAMSKLVVALLGVLFVGMLSAIIALSVVYSNEVNANKEPAAPAPTEKTTPKPSDITTEKPTARPSGKPTASPSEKPTPTMRPGPWNNIRLPKNLEPISYKVKLWPKLEPDPITKLYTFSGDSTVEFRCLVPTDFVIIHSNKLNYTAKGGHLALLKDSSGNDVEVSSSWLEPKNQYLVLELTAPLQKDATYTMVTEFVGELADDLAGFYRSEYTEGGVRKVVATTQMQPTDARKAFPCFDEPAMKATFDVTIIHKPEHKAISNMPIIDEKSITVDTIIWRETTFNTTLKMSTYLLAFIVCEFTYIEKIENGTQIRIWARPQAVYDGQADYAINITGNILNFFADYYKVAYPLPKSDQIALPDFAAGAMENWGLVTYRETALLYDPVQSSNGNKERVASVVAHELAHQWFGNLVTLKWWNDLWLNEGFASYVEYLGADYAEPTWELKDLFVMSELHRVFSMDSLVSSHPLSSAEEDINTPGEINELFDSISYSKGGSVLRMLSSFLTEPVFVEGLNTYLLAHQLSNAAVDDLWVHQQQAVDNNNVNLPKTVKEIMDTWTLQMGYPVIKLDTSNGNVTQKYFLIDPEAVAGRPSPFNYLWNVPITWKKDGPISTVWLLGVKDAIFPDLQSADKWVLLNIDEVGYYRVNYDVANWNRLLNQLQTDLEMIPVINRAQIIDDAFNLARAKHIDVKLALNTTLYLVNERKYQPWQATISSLSYFKQMLDRSAVFGNMQKYILQQVIPLYNYYDNLVGSNWNDVPPGHADQYNQVNAISLACSYNHLPCEVKASAIYKAWMENPDNYIIHANLKSTVYCVAIAAGGQAEWDFGWKMFKETSLATEADKLRDALACSKQTWILNRYLEYTLDPAMIRKQDATNTIVRIASNVVGQSLAWDFIRANWEYIFTEYGGGSFSFSRLIEGVTGRFSTDYELKQLEQFKADNQEVGFGSGTRALEQALERTKVNIKWRADNEKRIDEWFIDSIRP